MPLILAVERTIECLMLLLSDDRVDPNSKNNYNLTPLLFAAKNNKEECTKLLLSDDRVDPNAQDASGSTILMNKSRKMLWNV